MPNIAIRAEQLAKQYQLGKAKRRQQSLGEELIEKVGGLFRRKDHSLDDETILWALRDISFELKHGEVLGVIGRNGSGKSTLLKVLSRITRPTAGHATVHGRVSSLLEVGTGFHPELTGRENMYLNGAILGMRKEEIDRKFDEIVAFAEIERFLDTPVKRYSSGMFVRLAFAVAAHLEPEILIIDEVLAVGDAEFQKKCLGKMGDVAKEGRTVLFVSHNVSAVQQLCQVGLVLKEGRVTFHGKVGEAIQRYFESISAHDYGFADLSTHPGRSPGMPAIIKSLGILSNDKDSRYREVVTTGEDVVFEIQYDTGDLILDYAVIGIESASGDRICTVGTHLCQDFKGVMRGKGILECRIPSLPLRDNEYTVKIVVGRQAPRQDIDNVENAIQFKVELGNYFGTGQTLFPQQGTIAQRSQWQIVS